MKKIKELKKPEDLRGLSKKEMQTIVGGGLPGGTAFVRQLIAIIIPKQSY